MSLKGNTTAEKIWNFLIDKGLNEYGAAGLMGNLKAESALNPKNLQQTYEKTLGYNDDTYTAAVDAGTYTNFVRDAAGYGLAQWTYWSRKEALLNYAKSCKASIGDLEMQLCFLWKELSDFYGSVLNILKNAKSVLEASTAVLLNYERPANQGTSVQQARAAYGQEFYDKFAAKSSAATTSGSGQGLKVGDIVTFTGNKHYTNANAATGPACKPGKAKITAIYQLGRSKHPYHLIYISGGTSNVCGWVSEADIAEAAPKGAAQAAQSWTPKVGDIVTFNGSKHYANANAASGSACKAGKAKITAIYQLGKSKHPYHLINVSGGGSNVYGWVDAGTFTKA